MKYEIIDTYRFPRGLTAGTKYYPLMQRWLLSEQKILRIDCGSSADAKSAYYSLQAALRRRNIDHDIWRKGTTVTIIRPEIRSEKVFVKKGRPSK